eukprot:63138_1
MDVAQSLQITINIYINQQFESLAYINSAKDHHKSLNEKNKKEIQLSTIIHTIPSLFEGSKLFSALFEANDYQWKLYHYDKNTAKQIVNNNSLYREILKSNRANPEPIKLRVVFFKQDLRVELKSNDKQNKTQKPPFFVYITEREKTNFTVTLKVATKDKDEKRFYSIIETNTKRNLSTIVIKKNKKLGEQDIQFDKHHKKHPYSIAIHDKDSNKKLSQEINPIINTDFPTDLIESSKYKPNGIDISTIVEITNEKKKKIYLYWNAPSTVGKIKYKVICNSDDIKDKIVVEFPYEIPSTCVPVEMQIITMSIFGDDESDSDSDEDENSSEAKTFCSDPVIVHIPPKDIQFMIDYIHVKKKPVIMKFSPSINFFNFKKQIVNEFGIENDAKLQIACIDDDSKQIHVADDNFKSVLSNMNKINGKEGFMVGIYPEIPEIYDMNTIIKGELEIKLSKNMYGNTCYFEIKPEIKKTIKTTYSSIKINIKPGLKYGVRVKAVNVLGDSGWSKWSETCLPLHRFSTDDLCSKIQKWIDNDIIYENILKEFKRMSGYLPLPQKIKTAFLQFVTSDTLNIISDHFDEAFNDAFDEKAAVFEAEEKLCRTLYQFPARQLIGKIQNDKIDGEKIIDILQPNHDNIIYVTTGWSKQEIAQFKLVLFKDRTFTEMQLREWINHVSNISPTIQKQIEQIMIGKFDIEMLHYNIKNNKNIESFTDTLIDFLDKLKLTQTDDSHLVQNTYKEIARCFVSNGKHYTSATGIEGLDGLREWVCSKCGNYNFCQHINDKMNHNLEVCQLCGLTQLDSIILKIRGDDTFTSSIESAPSSITDMSISKDVQQVAKGFYLKCLNRTGNEACSSILRLAQFLIEYKEWIENLVKNKNAKTDISNTTQLDIEKVIGDDVYKSIFLETAKSMDRISDNDVKSLKQMLNDHVDNINELKTFLQMNKKEFNQIVANPKHSEINRAVGGKLFKKIKFSLHNKAGQHFLNNLASIQNYYYHILEFHIQYGTEETKTNAFGFFERVLHYNDTAEQIQKCVSIHRRSGRKSRRNYQQTNQIKNEKDKNSEHQEFNEEKYQKDRSAWGRKQYYMQRELDTIHSFLAHPHFKQMMEQQDDNKDENSTVKQNQQYTQNHAFFSQLGLGQSQEYGFGEIYEHHKLKPKFKSVNEETSVNDIYKIEQNVFNDSLCKAIEKQKHALDLSHHLICKYFCPEYNLIRGELIGIRHVFAIILYTDISAFCKEFRKTYRKLGFETQEELIESHCQLYFYARSLFESVEFFGQKMPPSMKVYHGLGVKLLFGQYTAQFNAPLSTTPKRAIATDFTEGIGIILELKSTIKKSLIYGPAFSSGIYGAYKIYDIKYRKMHNMNQLTWSHVKYKQHTIPNYLPVSWLSDFPAEKERLFYGSSFQITNIIEVDNNQEHEKEIEIFDRFNQTVGGQMVEWNSDMHQFSNLIQTQQRYKPSFYNYRPSYSTGIYGTYQFDYNISKPISYEYANVIYAPSSYRASYSTGIYGIYNILPPVFAFSEYSKESFRTLCIQDNKQRVSISNFESLPELLKNNLFTHYNTPQ